MDKLLGKVLLLSCLSIGLQADDSAIARGQYLATMGGCHTCHTTENGDVMAGGVELVTPYGTYFPPNITAHPQAGIGNWSQADFNRAMREGLSPKGEAYYPSFPYTSYTIMSDADLSDLKAYLDSLPHSSTTNTEHDLSFPFNLRFGLHLWQWLNFEPQDFVHNDQQTTSWNRGAYIVNGPGHCGECHTPRTITLAMDKSQWLMGNPDGPEGEFIPPINMAKRKQPWHPDDIVMGLEDGITPEGDIFGGSMAEVTDNTSQLTLVDLEAMADYLSDP